MKNKYYIIQVVDTYNKDNTLHIDSIHIEKDSAEKRVKFLEFGMHPTEYQYEIVEINGIEKVNLKTGKSESLPTYEMNESENFLKTINTDFGYFDKGKLTLFDKSNWRV